MPKQMSSWLRSTAFTENDEHYTPPILVEPILPFIPPTQGVWCPFDLENSEFVKAFQRRGNFCQHSHLQEGKDFFTYLPPEPFDIIVSNPPFTQKLKVLERLFLLGKPFAMLLPLPMLNYQEVGSFFLDKNIQLLIPDKKISFDGHTASFNTSYFCHRLLPNDLMFCHLPHNNTGKNFMGSSMGESILPDETLL